MLSQDVGSVTRWFGPLKAGDHDAAQQLVQRYFAALARRAYYRLRDAPRTAEDEEDVALSALDSFCRGVKLGRFPRLDDRHDLWRILVKIIDRHAVDQMKRELRHWQKRDATSLDLVTGSEPTPELAVTADEEDEEVRRRLDGLGDETLRYIAWRKMLGDTDEEIAAQLGRARRTVVRKLVRIRQAWKAEVLP